MKAMPEVYFLANDGMRYPVFEIGGLWYARHPSRGYLWITIWNGRPLISIECAAVYGVMRVKAGRS